MGRIGAIIVGGGFGGIGAAIALRRHEIDVTILERADALGGVWRDNDYPGSACDVPSHLYSYSFAPKRDWSRKFAGQAEILAYIQGTVDAHGLRPHVRLGVDVRAATFDERTGRWAVSTADGEVLTAEMVIIATGQMSTPDIPAVPGVETFRGPAFHSARWDHDVDLRGKRVAVVGTGSSAIQFVPRVAERADSVAVFQRSAGYVVPKDDDAVEAPVSAARHYLERYRTFLTKELLSVRVNHAPWMFGPVERRYRAGLRRQVPDPVLRAGLSATDRYGCKRLLMSNEWFGTLQRPHVRLHAEGVARVEPTGVVSASGEFVEADVLIWGTGFRTTDFLRGIDVRGAAGVRLADNWRQGASAYLGIMVPGFPSMFLVYGPNTNVGHNSILFMIECQLRFIAAAARRLRSSPGTVLDVLPEVEQEHADWVQRRSKRTVYAAGCSSWFIHPSGRHTQNWPGSAMSYWWRTRRIRSSHVTQRPQEVRTDASVT